MSVDNSDTTTIVLRDPHTVAFFRDNPHLDPDIMCSVFVDIMKQLSANLNATMQTSVNEKILRDLTTLITDVSAVKQDVIANHHNSMASIGARFGEFRSDYMTNLQRTVSAASIENYDRIQSLIEKNNSALIDKTHSLLRDAIPAANSQMLGQIDRCLGELRTTVKNETSALMNATVRDDSAFKNYFELVERQIATHMEHMRDKITESNKSNSVVYGELNTFLNKYRYHSSVKGSISENELKQVLYSLYPSDEVVEVGKQAATCDLRLNRLDENRPTVLFENKDYEYSVPTEEVLKFERDLETQKHHGVFLSQNSGIAFKTNLQCDVRNGLIHIYIPHAQYNPEKIRLAVDMIDALAPHVQERPQMRLDGTLPITTQETDAIVEEYEEFQRQKKELVDTVKANNKVILEKIEALQQLSLRRWLEKNNIIQTDDLKCRYCMYVGKNRASISAHLRNCKKNPSNK